MRDLIERYATDKEALERFCDVPLSEARADRLERFATEWQGRLTEVDFASLDRDGRVDYVAFRNHLTQTLGRLRHERARDRETREALGFADAVIELEAARRAMEGLQPEKAAQQLAAMREKVETLAKTLKPAEGEEPGISREMAGRCQKALGELRETLNGWYAHYLDFKPDFAWWLGEPRKALDKALDTLEKRVKKRVGDEKEPPVGAPIGREALLDDIAGEMLPYTPEELIAIADREFAWCWAEFQKAASELGYSEPWEAMEHVKGLHMPLGKQDELVAGLVREAIAFVEERDLVTIEPLCRETWRVDMISKDGQKTLPFQAYGGQKVLTSYPTHDMDLEAKSMSVRANNVHFIRCSTQHELIPGHHLQLYMGRRYNAHRRAFQTPFLVEGWCLHWEMLLWDLGFPQSPENRIGMLFWRMHRCARITVSLKFHLGEMTPEEMIAYLVKHVGHEKDSATGEVRRYVGNDYPPLYQCAYMIGGLQLRALYRDLVESGPMTAKAFHDAVLHENAIPIELIRASLEGCELTPDYTANWRFAGPSLE